MPSEDDQSLEFCETSLSIPPTTPIPKITIKQDSLSLLHATDTCLDFVSRNALNRHRSFIDHIRDIPGIGETSGRVARVKRSRGKKRHRHVTKYSIGLSSDDDYDEDGGEAVVLAMLPRKSPSQFLTVGRSHVVEN